ncbi:MAG: hypothetical protein LBN39_02965 [Planctomycetaceae bacterium]|jgi:hypothetical protein|nr:hypothetical protein [Planctomycetaceae bacterium]
MKTLYSVLLCCAVVLLSGNAASAQPNFLKNLGKSVEAEPDKEYLLADTNGPWLIYATSFSGTNGRKDANALVYELRKKHKFKAYLYEQKFVHDLSKESKRPQSPYARPLKYQKTGTVVEYAVVIGDFQSVEDNEFQKTLKAVKECRPEFLAKKQAAKDYSTWRGSTGSTPLSMAFSITNPLIPPEIQRGTVDKFIESINTSRPYSLLNCPNRYTVQIATFTGRVVIKPDEVKEIEEGKKPFSSGKTSELELGERAAVKLCKILREQGVEAYEFHDRYASIVTVGGFNSYEQRLPNGQTVYARNVQDIINRFQGRPSTAGTLTYEPVRFEGIECDVMPKVIEVPRRR